MLPARILLVEDHAPFRWGLHRVRAAGIPGLEASEAASLEEAMHCTMASPALVLLDIHVRVLVIDDDEAVRTGMQQLLTAQLHHGSRCVLNRVEPDSSFALLEDRPPAADGPTHAAAAP